MPDLSHTYDDGEADVTMTRQPYSLLHFNPSWSLAQDVLYGVDKATFVTHTSEEKW